jgi:flavin reductase (DIM6/NTAB) family NADH-FMN oxidoreductase RutF
MDGDAFDGVMRQLEPTMIVVTVASSNERAGCLVGFHGQCSIHPLRYAVWLSKANHTYRVALHADHLGVHFLSTKETELARLFGSESGDEVDKFSQCETELGPYGVPLLCACANTVLVRRTAMFEDGGDHVCFVTEPTDIVRHAEAKPLRLPQVEQLDPGHHSTERPEPPSHRVDS